MKGCELATSPDIELYFYGELEGVDRARVEAHLRRCESCRLRLDDLQVIRRALERHRVVDAPPGGDWSGFTRRLDSAVSVESPRGVHSAVPRSKRRVLRLAAACAAMLAIVTLGVIASRMRHAAPPVPQQSVALAGRPAPIAADTALREVSAEHLERSKLVVLGLATLDPRQTRAADWEYERQMAGALLDDTRLYRQAAQQHGLADVARVMRDLETVLIETSMSDSSDREALSRVQRLIAKRDLVVNMQLVATN